MSCLEASMARFEVAVEDDEIRATAGNVSKITETVARTIAREERRENFILGR